MGTQYHDVLSAQDVAVYGGLCALASFDRHELRNHVINNVSFRDYMEVNPEVMPLLLLIQSTSYALPLTDNPEVTPLLLEAGLCSQRHVLHGVRGLSNCFRARSNSP